MELCALAVFTASPDSDTCDAPVSWAAARASSVAVTPFASSMTSWNRYPSSVAHDAVTSSSCTASGFFVSATLPSHITSSTPSTAARSRESCSAVAWSMPSTNRRAFGMPPSNDCSMSSSACIDGASAGR